MITVKVSGGLGNQLFQYAVGRALQIQEGHQVEYDISPLDGDPQRCYLLDRLGLRLNTVKQSSKPMQMTLSDPDLRYRAQVRTLKGDWLLNGFWQCEKYFKDVQDTIRAEVFCGMPMVSDASMAFAEKIRSETDSCFLHIRRTDNTHPAHAAVHGLLDQTDYYPKALKIIQDEHPDAHFFVFSDDPEWAKVNYGEPQFSVSDCNPTSGTPKGDGELIKGTIGRENEDLWLMSLCKHGIVANSTFSWWGAWLNPLEKFGNRIIIAPGQKGWFNANQTRLDSTDIIPGIWIRI